MNEYKRPPWAVQQLYRASGLLEDICEHGVGHPNADWLISRGLERSAWASHGCDGCCAKSDKACEMPDGEKEEVGQELVGEVVGHSILRLSATKEPASEEKSEYTWSCPVCSKKYPEDSDYARVDIHAYSEEKEDSTYYSVAICLDCLRAVCAAVHLNYAGVVGKKE